MKKKLILIVSFLLGISVVITTLLLLNKKEEQFFLEDKYYGNIDMIEIEIADLEELINNKESFAVFVYQPMCVTSSDFENVLNEFLEDHPIKIYKIAFSEIKSSDLGESIKFYPSFAIYKEGKLVDFLEADKDEDVNYYSSKDEFYNWITKYIFLKDSDLRNDKIDQNQNNNEIKEETLNLDNIKKEKDKVNIYFFWGDGCPHCEKETEFFKSLEKEYGQYFNLYKYEVWYNKENANILNIFVSKMNDEITGVPYTIIGEKTFTGFSESLKEEFIEAIKNESKKDFDVYFDKIKVS